MSRRAGPGATAAWPPRRRAGVIRRQVTQIPPVRAEVTEHEMIGRRCGCGTVTWGKAPAGVTAPVQYGPRAAALGACLWHGQFPSRDRARAAMADLFGCAPSAGTLAAITRKIAGLIAPALDAVLRALLAAEVALRPDRIVGRGEAGLGPLRIVGEVRPGHRAPQTREGRDGRRPGYCRRSPGSPAMMPGRPRTATPAWPGMACAAPACSAS